MRRPVVLSRLDYSKYRNAMGSAFMALLCIWCVILLERTGRLFFLLVAFRNAVLSLNYLRRGNCQSQSSLFRTLVAVLATCMPVTYSCGPNHSPTPFTFWCANFLGVLGYSIATMAAIELGNQFSISPSPRGDRIESGLYRFLRHPMYTGYLIAESGWVIIDDRNFPFFLVSLFLQSIRAQWETFALSHKPASAT